jgi:hypothetical protein
MGFAKYKEDIERKYHEGVSQLRDWAHGELSVLKKESPEKKRSFTEADRIDFYQKRAEFAKLLRIVGHLDF